MSLQTSNIKLQTSRVPFNLVERTAKFGEEVVVWCQTLQANHVSRPLITQLVRSATSVGANYSEANNSSSRKDYRNKVHISKKEVQETLYWFRMLQSLFPQSEAKINDFTKEANELVRILQTITSKLNEESV